jgi:NTP pyrophosphatase (non-canonical NTP hydrolase)
MLSLTDAQKQVDKWIKLHGVRYFNELTNMAILTEEVGEVAKKTKRDKTRHKKNKKLK